MDMSSSNTNTRHTIYQTSRQQERKQKGSGLVGGLPQIGQLRTVDPLAYWGKEPGKFVTWLAQNDVISLLGQVLSLDLQLYDQVRQPIVVNADIVCSDVISEHLVLISNQLEEANYSQMGKLLSDAAYLDGAIFLLIAGGFP